jgi:hypothetical protein
MSSLKRLCGIVAAGLFLVPMVGSSQEKKDKAPEGELDGPGPVHKQMEPLAGSWDVEVKFILDGKEHTGKAKCEAKWILDGRFLQQEYKSNFMGKPFTVLQHLGYDNQKRKTIEIMMDSMGTGVIHNEGSISKDGKVITNEGESHDPATGKNTKLRTVYTIADKDQFTLEWFKSGADGKDEKVVSMTHTRRKQ